DRTVARDLDLRRVSGALRLRVERERLIARVELEDRRRAAADVGDPDVAVGILRHVVRVRAAPWHDVCGDAPGRVIDPAEVAWARARGPHPEPDVVLRIDVQPADLRRVSRRRED